MRVLPAVFLCLASILDSGWSLSCLPCREVTCEMPARVKHCAWGLVLDMCGCCYVCGKGPGQTCGGQWAWHGRCGRGLECREPTSNSGTSSEGGGNALALLAMDEPARCAHRNDSLADKINSFFTWLSSLFQNVLNDD
ncbi:single insulin-like growth factor-binding domain protein-2 [Panulirus ornatus]|uniref:single insulin-like growth factor-binding domain protein-2 n=1 Tax=Panulirus ornatus TaxID=150431 RepID=UPI003A86DD2E